MRQRRRALLAAVLAVAFAAAVVAAEEDDLYETLGVPRDATKRTIKKEYYRLAKTWHPDKHPGDAKVEARFKKISRAYEVLFDDEQRRKYDQFGHEGLRNDGGGGGGGGPFHFHSSGGGQGFRMQFDDDIFSGFFGNDGGFGRGFGGGFGGGGFHHEEQPRQRVCHYNKICAARGCSLQKECKMF